MAKEIPAGKSFKITVEVEGKEGLYALVRKGAKNSRILKLGETGEGEIVATASLKEVPQILPSDVPVDSPPAS